MEGLFTKGWDLARIDRLAAEPPEKLTRREKWGHPQFEPVACASFADFDTYMGHEIAREVQSARQAGRPLIFIPPAGPLGLYRRTGDLLKGLAVGCAPRSRFN